MNLDDIQLSFRANSVHHRVIYSLAKKDGHVLELRKTSGSTVTSARVREILAELKDMKLVQYDGNDHWSITTKGLHVSVILGTPANSVLKRSTSEKMNELFRREVYEPRELGFTCLRQGAYDAYLLPSRIANRLHYRGGRVETITHGEET